jgi:phage I-like protein
MPRPKLRGMHKQSFLHAACFALAANSLAAAPAVGGKAAVPTSRIQVLPAGVFASNDGRPAMLGMGYNTWTMDDQAFAAMQAAASAKTNDVVVDFDHKTICSMMGEENPAAGWVANTALEFIAEGEGAGLFATVQWTVLGAQALADRTYRYISPVFGCDESGRPVRLHSIALTNNPALDSMAAVALSKQTFSQPAGAAGNPHHQPGEPTMLLVALCTALGMQSNTNEQSVLTAVTALSAENARLKEGQFDPAKHIPLAQHAEVQNALSALQTQVNTDQHTVVLSKAVADGKVLPAQEAYWKAQPLAALQAYIEVAHPITALSGQQSQGKQPGADTGGVLGLSPDELAICSATGRSPESFAKTKARLAADKAAARTAGNA